MRVTPDNYGDAEKSFSGCFIKVKEYGDTICLLQKALPQALIGEDEHGNAIAIEIDGHTSGKVGYDLDYIIPKKTFYQRGNYAMFLSRIPARQWKKGICKANTALHRVMQDGGFAAINLTFEELAAYTKKPDYQTPDQIQGKYSVALSPRFALTHSGDVLLDQAVVGRAYLAKKLVLASKLFVDDIISLFPTYTVKALT